ncbi:hypothetical protein JD969_00115 [Planctomycetota bacterium]|nr:hypothetical protein JD969_00115 [Planctomycetota bacterium]
MAVSIMLICGTAFSQSKTENQNHKTPLIPGKPVIAHYMTDINAYNDNWRIKSEHFRPDGPSKGIGGGAQYVALLPYEQMKSNKSREKIVEEEIRTAMKMGIDGFHFYYVLWQGRNDQGEYTWNDIIRTFFDVCEKKNLDFKLTLCLSHPGGKDSADDKINKWALQINDLINGLRDSNHWLRDRNGRIVFMSWHGDSISDLVPHNGAMIDAEDLQTTMKSVRSAYDKLFQKIKVEAMFVYHIMDYPTLSDDTKWQAKYDQYIKAAVDNFEAVTGFVPTITNEKIYKHWAKIRAACKRAGVDYVQAAYIDFYDSKVFQRNKPHKLLNSEKSVNQAKVSDIKKHYIPLRGTENFRLCLQKAKDWDASMVTITTWNDYPEGHHIAPSLDHNYVPAVLLDFYKKNWQIQNYKNQNDIALVTYRKHPWEVKPLIFDIPMSSRIGKISDNEVGNLMDVIEVVTILKQPARVYINKKFIKRVSAGLQSVYIPLQKGKVEVDVVLKSKRVIKLRPTEWITYKPYRTDRSLIGWSSEYNRYTESIFGSYIKLPILDEYVVSHGEPNWKKRYKIPIPQ